MQRGPGKMQGGYPVVQGMSDGRGGIQDLTGLRVRARETADSGVWGGQRLAAAGRFHIPVDILPIHGPVYM
jgi:hypothetical protein